jgi:hypothetical protein
MHASFDQADAEPLYEQLRPDQRTAIALEFVRCLRLVGDSAAEQFMAQAEQADVVGEKVEVIGGALVTPRLLTAQQAAAIHRYTFDHYPDCFTQVLRHPLTQAVLTASESPLEPSLAHE